MFAERDKHYPSRSMQTSLATAVTNFTKPVTRINFGPSMCREKNTKFVNPPPKEATTQGLWQQRSAQSFIKPCESGRYLTPPWKLSRGLFLPSSNYTMDRQELRHQIGLSESAEKGSGAVAKAYKLLREASPLPSLVALENDWKGKNLRGPPIYDKRTHCNEGVRNLSHLCELFEYFDPMGVDASSADIICRDPHHDRLFHPEGREVPSFTSRFTTRGRGTARRRTTTPRNWNHLIPKTLLHS